MPEATVGRRPTAPAGARQGWRLVGAPPPIRSERLSRLVGLRVLRLPGSRRMLVLAGSVDRLRDLATHPEALTPVRRLTLVVAWWRYPWRGWSGGFPPLRHLMRHRVSLPARRGGVATVRLRLARPVRVREVLDTALAALGGPAPVPAPVSAELTSNGPPPAWLPAQAGATTVPGPLPDNPDIRGYDVVLLHGATPAVLAPDRRSPSAATAPVAPPPAAGPAAPSPAPSPPVAPPAYAVARPALRHAVLGPDGEPVVLVDARRINPRGRRAEAHRPGAPRVRLEFTGDRPAGRGVRWSRRVGTGANGWRPGGPAGGGFDDPGLDAATLAALRQTGVVECPLVPETDPVPTAALLVQVAMTGAVLHAPRLPAPVAGLLAGELREIVVGAPPEDALALEARSVRQRRAALRHHATAFRLPDVVAGTLPELARPPSVSVILATRRPEMLPAALRAVIGQTYPELEILVCLHGVAPPPGLRATLDGCGRPVEIIEISAGASFGEVLGIATRRARGSLITKFDDDDSYGPEHVWDLVLARHYSGATLVGRGIEFVHLETLGLTVRRSSGVPEADGEVVAGGTMLLAKGDLEAVGGWRPVPRSVDLGLIERLRRAGARIYRTHPLGYIYHRRANGHTWDPGERYFLDSAFERWPGLPADALAGPLADPPGPARSAEPVPAANPPVVGAGGVP